MFRKLLAKLIFRFYVYANGEIVKLNPLEERLAFLLSTQEDTLRIIKSLLTTQTITHFNAKSEEERLLVKGAAGILQFLKEAHLKAVEIENENETPMIKDKKWRIYRG